MRYCLALALSTGFLLSSVSSQSIFKIADDDDGQFTSVGNISLTISNFATIGTRNRYWPTQPSCEYPRGSLVEHIYQGGLWVGGRPRNRPGVVALVSTGVTDRSSSSGIGYEFTSEFGSIIHQRSSLSDSRFFSETAVSHQDFLAEYTDRNTRVPGTGDSILAHQPLGLIVSQESYAWNFPFADFFVILNYRIVNAGADTLDEVYVGLWNNAVVRNTNFVRPGTTGYFDRGGNGYDSLQRTMYTFEFDPTPGGGPADSYIGIKLLGTTPFPVNIPTLDELYRQTFYNAWRFRSSSGDAAYFSPDEDYRSDNPFLSRYHRLSTSLPLDKITPLRTRPDNMTTLLSTGPWQTLNPGDTIEVVFAVVCAKKFGSDPERFDTPEQRATLLANLQWAQQTYDGEDTNGNNILDPGEDLNGNGKLDRYVLPSPPRQPRVRAVVDNQDVVIYWDKASAEESIDPISKEKDFEGYRIYRSTPGADFLSPELLLLSLSPVGEFDKTGNDVGYNTGFGEILLPEAKTFPGDQTEYWYRFPPVSLNVTHLNGWQYLYGVSAFDRGDLENNLPILESASAIVRVVPGTPATSNPDVEVGVYPNPYYGRAYWDGSGERSRKLYFYNLPGRCIITIYTIAGDVVAELDHDAATYTGDDIEWFRRFGDRERVPQFAGGERAWDLISRFDQAISSGLYLFSVRDKDNGTVKTGKFLVVK
ncbi:MAG: hypothetical protein HYW57_08270 [Ignavibacteriales bacterium]|nr:hypothetical protein [Ignavibacteriales bacterium]